MSKALEKAEVEAARVAVSKTFAAVRAKECEDIITSIRSTTWSGSEEIVAMIKRRIEDYVAVADGR